MLSYATRFMCRCDDEGRAECAEIEAKAKEILSRGDTTEWSDLDFVNVMLYELALDGELSFAADQWGGVGYTLYRYDSEQGKSIEVGSVSFMCDSFIDGLAALVVWKKEKEDA